MSRGTLDPAVLPLTSVTGLSPSLAGLSSAIPLSAKVTSAVRTPQCTHCGLGSFHFARRYFGNRILSFFSSGYLDVSVHRVPLHTLLKLTPLFMHGSMESVHGGFPIQKSVDQWIFAPPHGFSQLITSFFGSQCQGIHPALFTA